MKRQPIGKRSTESDAAKWARKTDQADGHPQMPIDPAKAEAEREQAIKTAIARVVGPHEARKLVAATPPATEPALTAYEASKLRRAAAQRSAR